MPYLFSWSRQHLTDSFAKFLPRLNYNKTIKPTTANKLNGVSFPRTLNWIRSLAMDKPRQWAIRSKINFQNAILFTKVNVYLAWIWPPSKNASKWEMIKRDTALLLSVLSALLLLLPLLAAMYNYPSNPVIVTQSASITSGIVSVILKTLVHRIRREKMRILVYEMEDFLKNPRSHETIILQNCVNTFSGLHIAITAMTYITAIAFIFGPLVACHPLPAPAVYPFSVDSGFPKYLAYVHHAYVGFQCATSITTDCQVALIMWFAAARLEMLANQLKGMTSVGEFKRFVHEHQRLLTYADNIAETMAYTSLVTAMLGGMGIVMSSLQLVGNQPFELKAQYCTMISISILCLFVSAWPAENLLRTCDLIATTAYNTSWTDMPRDMVKNIHIVLRRSQRPVTVSIGGFLPSLSLRFYASFLSAAISYFTTLRAILLANAKNA